MPLGSNRTVIWFLITASILLVAGCKHKPAPEQPTGSYLESIYSTANTNPDVDMFGNAMPPYLEYMDSLLLSSIDPLMFFRTAGAYYGYAYCFVEDTDKKEASELYIKGRNYAQSELKRYRSYYQVVSYDSTVEAYRKALDYNFDQRNIAALYWTAMNWAGWVNLNLDKPEAASDIPKLEAMLEYIIKIDGSYNSGSVYAALGALHANRSKENGGDPERARDEFDAAFTYSGNSYLTFHVLYAQYYAVQTKDRELFQKTLTTVLETPADTYPDKTFVNAVARKKAKTLLDNIDKYFKPSEAKEKKVDIAETPAPDSSQQQPAQEQAQQPAAQDTAQQPAGQQAVQEPAQQPTQEPVQQPAKQ